MASADAAAQTMQGVARAIRELARVPAVASREASRGIARQIQRQFDAGKDPYGRPWKPLAKSTVQRKGHDTINVETTELRGGIEVAPMSGAGIQVTIDADYAKYVQRVRPILPTGRLPRAWAQEISDAMQSAKLRIASRSGAIVDSADAMLELAMLLEQDAAAQ